MLTMFRRISGWLSGTALMLVCLTTYAQIPGKVDVKETANVAIGVPELIVRARNAYTSENFTEYRQLMSKLHELRPNNSEYMYHLVLANALLDDKSAAFNIMLQMQRQGLSYDFNQTEASLNLRKTEIYTYLNDLMLEAGKPLGNATEFATLAAEVILPEGIEWDSSRNAILVSTVRSGSIIAISEDGSSEELFKADESNRIWGIYDLAVDVDRNRLWAISSSNEDFSGFDATDKGRSVLIEMDLASMEIIKRYPVPVDALHHKLRNVTVSPKGDVFIIDGVFPIVYAKLAGESSLKPLAGYKNMVSLRGMALSEDGSILYLADYEMGILAVNLKTMQARNLLIPETLNLGGIAGMYYWNHELVIIQNGIKPQRIMSLQLNASGTAVRNVTPLAVNLEAMDFPNYGTVVGNDLLFFANSHWASRMESLKPVTISKISLTDAPIIMSPDAKKFMREYQQAKGTGQFRKVKLDGVKQDQSESDEEQKD